MFTIRPRLRKDEVDVLPYNIPCEFRKVLDVIFDAKGLWAYII